MMRLLIVVVLLQAVVVHAGPPAQTIRLRSPNAKEIGLGPAPRLLAENAQSVGLSNDGRFVVAIEQSALVTRALPGGTPTVLGAAPAWFGVTTDSSRLVSMGPTKVWPLGAADGGQPLGDLGAPERAIVGSTRAAALGKSGTVVSLDLASGAQLTLPIEPPSDKRCHRGNGLPAELSEDERWLLFQHGCVFDLIRTDGSKTRELGFSSATLVGTVVAGDVRPEGVQGDPTSLVVVELNTGARWSIPGVRLHPAFWRLPGKESLVFLDETGRLVLVELRAKKVTVLRDSAPRAVTAAVRPDGRLLVVTRDDQEHTCGVLELDPVSKATRLLLDASGIEQCFAHPTRTGTIVMAWRYEAPREVVLVEVDAKGVARQLGPAMADVGNLTARGGQWVFQPRARPTFLYGPPQTP